MTDNNHNHSPSAGGYITAFAIGAGIALLCAPHSGKETRQLLAQKSQEWKEKAEEAAGKAKEFIHNT